METPKFLKKGGFFCKKYEKMRENCKKIEKGLSFMMNVISSLQKLTGNCLH